MREVLEFYWDFRAKWKMIGILLGIDMGTLDSIEKDNKKGEDCLVELISTWLKGASPRPTRSTMAAVLQSKQVAGEKNVAPGECHV